MASTSHTEKDGLVDPYAPHTPIPSKSSYFNPISPFTDAYDRFAQWRTDLGLPHPGTVENLQKEVKCERALSVKLNMDPNAFV